MTEEEKLKIYKLRNQGYGYKKIAIELGINQSTIQSFIKRNNFDSSLLGVCKECGTSIKSIKGKKKREFCSNKCRMNWWNSHRDNIKHKNSLVKSCKFCGTDFLVFGNSKKIYCSHQCYINDKRNKSHG